jgi:hypothetical protein
VACVEPRTHEDRGVGHSAGVAIWTTVVVDDLDVTDDDR